MTLPDGYVRTFSDACDQGGEVELVADSDVTCIVTLDHVPAPPEGSCIDYPHFEGATGLNVLGDAALTDDVLLLNPDSGGLGGAWFGARMPVASGFTTDFEFRITPPGGGADGLAFVIQTRGSDALGVGGGGMGYHLLPNSLAVEIDTFSNFEHDALPGNHVAVHSRGTGPNSAYQDGQLGAAALGSSIKDGELHHVRVVYVPGRLDVFVDDMTTPALAVPVDLSSLLELDNGTAFAGFTAATGGIVEGHQIESWRLCSVPASATLHAVTEVVNDDGGARGPGDFNVHVRRNGVDVVGSPAPGVAGPQGRPHSLPAGEYAVSVDAGSGYVASFSGSCDAVGSVTLVKDQEVTCTVPWRTSRRRCESSPGPWTTTAARPRLATS